MVYKLYPRISRVALINLLITDIKELNKENLSLYYRDPVNSTLDKPIIKPIAIV